MSIFGPLILSTGHCGSIALSRIVRRSVHSHSLLQFSPFSVPFRKLPFAYGLYIMRLISLLDSGQKVVLLIRDPVDINISGFFHSLHHYISKEILRHPSALYELDCSNEFVADLFLRRYCHSAPLNFAAEVKFLFGSSVHEAMLDLLLNPFKMYRFAQRRFDSKLLILNTKALAYMPEEVCHYLGLDDCSSVPIVNSAQSKYYKSVKDQFRMPPQAITLYRNLFSRDSIFPSYAISFLKNECDAEEFK